MSNEIAALFLDYSMRKIDQMTQCLDQCLDRLDDEQLWRRSAAHENTVGNLVLHLCGNVRQWVMHGVGGLPDSRTRDAEFSAGGGLLREQLRGLFHSTIAEARQIIATLPHERLTESTQLKAPPLDNFRILDAIYQVVGHLQLHIGQIILLTKQMSGQDLDLSIPRPR